MSQSSCDSFENDQRDWGSQSSEEKPSLVKCTLVLMSGGVLSSEFVNMGDLSIGNLFNIAKTTLSVTKCEIQLAIGTTRLTAANSEQMCFALDEVQEMIREHGEVKVVVVRVDPRNCGCCVHGRTTPCLQSRGFRAKWEDPFEDVKWEFDD